MFSAVSTLVIICSTMIHELRFLRATNNLLFFCQDDPHCVPHFTTTRIPRSVWMSSIIIYSNIFENGLATFLLSQFDYSNVRLINNSDISWTVKTVHTNIWFSTPLSFPQEIRLWGSNNNSDFQGIFSNFPGSSFFVGY